MDANDQLRRAARSEGGVEQTCEPMNKHRIGGRQRRTSESEIAKSSPVKNVNVDRAVVRGRRSGLAREACVVSRSRDLENRKVAPARRKSRQPERLIEEICDRKNRKKALKRVDADSNGASLLGLCGSSRSGCGS
jgi:hypothetical protein